MVGVEVEEVVVAGVVGVVGVEEVEEVEVLGWEGWEQGLGLEGAWPGAGLLLHLGPGKGGWSRGWG